jgi:hypothetical protein
MAPSGIEPVTFRLVAHSLNQLRLNTYWEKCLAKKPEIPISKTGLELKRNSITHGDIKTIFT